VQGHEQELSWLNEGPGMRSPFKVPVEVGLWYFCEDTQWPIRVAARLGGVE
jgi:hypothetical protein